MIQKKACVISTALSCVLFDVHLSDLCGMCAGPELCLLTASAVQDRALPPASPAAL